MLHSTHYNLNLAEGTDLVNPLTVDVPNYQTIDSTMYANEQSGIGNATELKTGTIHAITRTAPARNVFKFTATSIFNLGDTFTVDGSTVTTLYPNQSSLQERCFIVGSDVLCMLNGSQLTLLTTFLPRANEVPFDDTNVNYTASNVQSAIENASTANGTKYAEGISVKDKLDNINTITLIGSSSVFGQDISLVGHDYKHFHVDIIYNPGGAQICESFELFPGANLLSATMSYISGHYANASSNSYFQINASGSGVSLAYVFWNGVQVTAGPTLYVYGVN